VDLSSVSKVTKNYNWRGEHVGYQTNGTSIPCVEGNADYGQLRERIKRGECSEHEPKILAARKVYATTGELTGHDTNVGFVPNRPANRLHQLLQEAISSGLCVPEEPLQTATLEPIQALILCAVLDRRWHHLAGPFERAFAYRSHERAEEIDVTVRIRNIPEPPTDIAKHLFDALHVEGGSLDHLRPLQLGMIEVEVPIGLLQKLFRNERNHIPTSVSSFVEDALALHQERTGRSASKGPDIAWLLDMAGYCLTRLFADLSNMAIRAFTLEYGGVPPGHVREDSLLRSHLCFARFHNGQIYLRSLQHQGEQSFALKGQWPEGATLGRLADPVARRQTDFWQVASRIRELISAGFALEALVVANALLEVVLEQALAGAVSANGQARELIRKKGHNYRLELFKTIVDSKSEPGFDTKEFQEFGQAIEKIYSLRNAYLHQLALPVDSPWKMVEMDRMVDGLARFITDPHLLFITVGFLSSLQKTARSETVTLLLSELKRLPEWERKVQ
jgi:hypothetical protein